jgi:D-alanyl-D-alanine carboxypeptidase
MKGAAGIVSTPEDVARWARALYVGPMLAPKPRAELRTLVSMKTGEPIKRTTVSDPSGFGLGVIQLMEPTAGTVWFYEGETNGYRMEYLYFPHQDAVIALGANSAVDVKRDALVSRSRFTKRSTKPAASSAPREVRLLPNARLYAHCSPYPCSD